MNLKESIGRFSVRKSVRFSMKETYCRAEWLEHWISDDERRAAALNTVKAAIEAEHLTMVRRVFKALPNPLPDAATVRRAFENDPEYRTLSGRSADKVMKLIVERCRYNGWTVPDPVRELEHWATLYVKWHWFCAEKLVLAGENSLPRQWAGRSKAEVERTCPLLRTPKRRKPSRNYWFDHAPFRMLFDNQTCGMSWLREDFSASRTFLMLEESRIFVGIVPRDSRFSPFTLPDPEPGEATCLLYEETQGEAPRLRPIPRRRLDLPLDRGLVFLFELDARALRGSSNLNARYLRALFSPENIRNPVIHLDRVSEFHVRKGTELPRDGKSDRFRQRFTEDKFFVTLHLTINAPLVAIGSRPRPYGNLAKFLVANPTAKLITVPAASRCAGVGRDKDVSVFVGDLARRVIAEDAYVAFAPNVPKKLLSAAANKFAYIVLKDRDPLADGGVLRGYQLLDRLFVGSLKKARAAADKTRAAAETAERERQEKAARKAEARARTELGRKQAVLRQNGLPPDFSAPLFKTGKFLFKVEYKTCDNVSHAVECRADSRDEMYQKAKSVRVRPSRVTCLDESLPLPLP